MTKKQCLRLHPKDVVYVSGVRVEVETVGMFYDSLKNKHVPGITCKDYPYSSYILYKCIDFRLQL